MVASLWLLLVLTVSDAQTRRPRNEDGEAHRGKRKKDRMGKKTLRFRIIHVFATVQSKKSV